jgi:hypothetical protein
MLGKWSCGARCEENIKFLKNDLTVFLLALVVVLLVAINDQNRIHQQSKKVPTIPTMYERTLTVQERVVIHNSGESTSGSYWNVYVMLISFTNRT